MALDTFLIAFALSAGASTFFSPCSVGLFPAYIGFYLASGDGGHTPGNPSVSIGKVASNPTIWDRLGNGMRLGGLAASGVFSLFLGVGFTVSQIGTQFLAPYLRWISIGIGAAIIALGLLMLADLFPTLHPPIHAPRSRTATSVFMFGIGYGLASLGCTLPIFLSALLASLASGGAWTAFWVVLAYAAGMGLVMIAVTASLSVSERAARKYIRNVVPQIRRVSAAVMVFAGGVLVYFYAVIWR